MCNSPFSELSEFVEECLVLFFQLRLTKCLIAIRCKNLSQYVSDNVGSDFYYMYGECLFNGSPKWGLY